jgi:sugar lactone lactonase YvrE
MRPILNPILCFLVLSILASNAFAQVREITSVAGTGTAGYSGDGGPAAAARLNAPSDVSVGSGGNFYIADRNNNRIRKVDGATGVITTVAGSGVAGWFFSGGPALFASLDHPSGVAVDAAGNFYIADLLENNISRIHKVTAATGMINRIELPVVLFGAVAIALDSAGNLYIAEQAGHRIRKVVLATGSMTTIAGIGVPGFSGDGGRATAAHINGPAHLTVDSAGNVYFSDSLNNRIRKVTAGGVITTVAGTGAGGFGGDGGLATSAEINNPRGVAVDAAGNLFIADTLNKRIRRISAKTGVITTIVSTELTGEDCAAASASLKSPDSLAVNASGTLLYVVDVNGNRIWMVTLDPNSLPPALTSIAPPNGATGTTVTATLSGTGFLGGTGATGTSACRVNGTTVFVSGAGVSVAGVNVTTDTSLTATMIIAPDAQLGPRDVTVTTDSGTSGAVQFTVIVPLQPPPALTSITPPSGVRGSSATFTLTGTNFDTRPGSTGVLVDLSVISPTDVRVADSTSLTVTFTISADAPLDNYTVAVVTPGGSSNKIPFLVQPQGPTFIYGLPQTLNPTEQTPIQVGLASPFPDDVAGKLTLTFVPNASNSRDDPNVMFINSQTSTRTVDVTFAANTATAELSLPSGVLQAGTVAGSIELTMTEVQVGGIETSPTSGDFDVQVPQLVPIITNVRIVNRSPSGFDVEVTGYSTSREVSAATFSFGAATGAILLTVQLQPDVASSFGAYYQSEVSSPAGGAFMYLQPFIVQQGDVKAVASVTVTLTNAQGTSEPRTAQ